MFLGTNTLLTKDLCPAARYFFCFGFVFVYFKFLTGLWRTVQSEDQYRGTRTCSIFAFVTLVEHRFHPTKMLTTHHDVAIVKCSVLHQHGGYITTTFIKRRFHNGSIGFPFRIGFQVQQFSFQQHFLQQKVHIQTLLGRQFLALEFTTPFFHEEVHTSQLFIYLLGIRTVFIDLVDREDHRYTSGLCVTDGLFCLRHHGIIRRDHDHRNVCNLSTTGTHSRKRFVTWCIQECYRLTIRKIHLVRTDVLGDTTRFTRYHRGVSNIVEQRCLTMVNVTHDGHYRRSWNLRFLIIHFRNIFHLHLLLHVNEFHFVSKLTGHQFNHFRIETLVDRHHHAEVHTLGDHICDTSVHQ